MVAADATRRQWPAHGHDGRYGREPQREARVRLCPHAPENGGGVDAIGLYHRQWVCAIPAHIFLIRNFKYFIFDTDGFFVVVGKSTYRLYPYV